LIIERNAVRAILLSRAHEVLLLRVRPPDGRGCFWIAPGGGREAHETAEDTLRRELREELGLDSFQVGPLVWRRQHTFNWAGRRICQSEHYHVVHVERFEPVMSDPAEQETLAQFRWWPAAELDRIGEPKAPESLGEIVARYLTAGPPPEPPEWEVLVD
jgi:8-oxo-dGTP pyrophosphatase MutT (NUDIX family)